MTIQSEKLSELLLHAAFSEQYLHEDQKDFDTLVSLHRLHLDEIKHIVCNDVYEFEANRALMAHIGGVNNG